MAACGASFLDTARYLERCGYRTSSGKLNWSARQVYFEWFKYRVARGRGLPAKRLEAEEDAALFRAMDAGDSEEVGRILDLQAFRKSMGVKRGATTYPVRTKVKTLKDRSRVAWWEASKAARQEGKAGPPEPLFDSRGRPLKGRRFSRIKKT